MSDALDPRSALDAAQDAAGAGDYQTAERLLREAAAMQEATLGPLHPELATTLNNLAFVCERTNKLDEAERGYRRAHAIAVASLSPGHPFVATSLKNLLDFCASRGVPVWAPPAGESSSEAPAPVAARQHEPELAFKSEAQEEPAPARKRETPPAPVSAKTESAPVATPVPTKRERVPVAAPVPTKRQEAPAPVPPTKWDDVPVIVPAPRKEESRPRFMAIAALSVGALVALLFIWQWRGADDPRRAPDNPPAPSTQARQPSSESRSAATPPPPAAAPEPEPAPAPAPPPAPEPAEPSREETPRAGLTAITVLNAQVCRSLARRGSPDWECTPVSGPGEPGTYSFYTRLQSPANTTVEHRWYYGDALHQRMRLRVGASDGGGFRTYSTNTVSPERAGDWKVELRAADGTLLQEERFVVR